MVDKRPPANAEDTGSIPAPGRSHTLQGNKAHAPQLLSLIPRTLKPQLRSQCDTIPEACTYSLRFTREATAVRRVVPAYRN